MPKSAHQIPLFERQEVDRCSVRITRAGDGLSEALKIEPKALLLGQEVFYVVRGRVTQVNHRMQGEDETVTRMHTIEVQQITEVPRNSVARMLDEAEEALQRARDEASGQTNLVTGSAKPVEEDERDDPDDDPEAPVATSESVTQSARRQLDALPTEPAGENA